KILILHGAEDQSVPMTDVNLLIESLKKQKKDFSVHIFADAVHGFTHKHDQVRYNKKADERSWKIMLDFFKE
ncbi:MAG TPA: dienelactone hydrolase family protein, partial [Spirochaetota bacterium]|nr:dienelactone hydrolase family protein [Spirochaetota bacterium]